MIPGPVEFEPKVIQALSQNTTSHIAPNFIQLFKESLKMMREVWLAKSGQPFIISGSGTLAMEMPVANLLEEGDKVLVISTGYFGKRYAELIRRYGVEPDILEAPLGGTPDISTIEQKLKTNTYKLMTFTHVDTSTAVMVDPKPIGELGKKYGVLTILDGVCSVAGEEIKQEEWGIDVTITASQKAIGVPPGLALLVVSRKAMEQWKSRKSKVANYYCDWNNWLPIMEAYEEGKPSYFATPPVNLIASLHQSLKLITEEGMEKRFLRHKKYSKAVKRAVTSLGMKQVPLSEKGYASTLTAPYYPEGVPAIEFLTNIKKAGVIVAGGLHPDIKTKYFRIGHMGAVTMGDILATIGAVEYSLKACGYKYELGKGVAEAQKELLNE
jgi:alanine-glyoxylate transaminase/serine-glyoxylate transaminase/serine-pyruvate transaminase